MEMKKHRQGHQPRRRGRAPGPLKMFREYREPPETPETRNTTDMQGPFKDRSETGLNETNRRSSAQEPMRLRMTLLKKRWAMYWYVPMLLLRLLKA